jgi:osmotically-inducible protein OsmY
MVDDSPNPQEGVPNAANEEATADERAEVSWAQSSAGDWGPCSSRDRKLLEEVAESLRATGYLTLRELNISAADGVVTLKGRVPTYYLKHVILRALREAPGVGEVRDFIEVSTGGPV